jgi:hypothetical protein
VITEKQNPVISKESSRRLLGLVLATILCASCSTAGPSDSGTGVARSAAVTVVPTVALQPSPTALPNPAPQALGGYLAHASNGVVFLQWTQSGAGLNGTLTQAYTHGGDPTTLTHDSASFSGVLTGGSVTLNFSQGLGISGTWTGTFSGNTLTLSYPAADGTLSTLTFGPGSVADYNSAVAYLQAQAAGAAAANAAQAALDQAVAEASDRLGRAVNQMNGDASQASSHAQQTTEAASAAGDALSNVQDALGRCSRTPPSRR